MVSFSAEILMAPGGNADYREHFGVPCEATTWHGEVATPMTIMMVQRSKDLGVDAV